MNNKPKTFNQPVKEIPNLTKKKRVSFKTKVKLAAGITFMIFLVFFGLLLNEFIQTHTFKYQFPVVVRKPVIIKRVEIISPMSSKSASLSVAYAQEIEHPREYTVNEIVDTIYTLESSRGVQDGCRDKGLYNGYGYSQSTYSWTCYQTQDQVTRLVADWVQDKIDKGYTTAELLCYYNRGIKEQDCPYYQNFLSLTK